MHEDDARRAPATGGVAGCRTFAGLELTRTLVMGVVNVTPDSFSDGGETFATRAAVARGLTMLGEGADIIDVGGESTRPGASPVQPAEEIARVAPVVLALSRAGAAVSVDTRHAAVMRAALENGAKIINDITALTGDSGAIGLVAGADVSVILMHMQGEPSTMQLAPHYDDAAREVRDWLTARVAACEAAGISRHRIAVDPGVGFGKTTSHNLEIIADLDDYATLGCAVAIGVSRKSFIGGLSDGEQPKERLAGSLAAALFAVQRGADIVRVHDVRETRQALSVWRAIAEAAAARDATFARKEIIRKRIISVTVKNQQE
jgi:dihydropteroate synthase